MMLQIATADETASNEQEDQGNRSDRELVSAANAGDSTAFAELYQKHRDWVANLAYRFSGDRELALDVLQETFLYFWKKFPGFVLSSQLRTFFYPVVKNLSITRLKKASRYVSDEEIFHQTTAPVENQEDGTADMLEVFAALPAAQREVLVMRYLEEFSLEEIAQALEIPLGTVKSRLHNALIALRKAPKTRSYFTE